MRFYNLSAQVTLEGFSRGGSITEMRGWRTQIEEDLRQRFPDTEFTFAEAGIASTGTTPRAFRLENDILQHGTPDLLFTEAAVNDDTNHFNYVEQPRGIKRLSPSELFLRGMETNYTSLDNISDIHLNQSASSS